MNLKNKGRFYLQAKLIREDPKIVADILSDINFVPLRVEAMFHDDSIEYVGLSPRFDAVEPGKTYPTYDINTTYNFNGTINQIKVTKRSFSLDHYDHL
jgi:hypothetical protein